VSRQKVRFQNAILHAIRARTMPDRVLEADFRQARARAALS
jgi:hypothetical protein